MPQSTSNSNSSYLLRKPVLGVAKTIASFEKSSCEHVQSPQFPQSPQSPQSQFSQQREKPITRSASAKERTTDLDIEQNIKRCISAHELSPPRRTQSPRLLHTPEQIEISDLYQTVEAGARMKKRASMYELRSQSPDWEEIREQRTNRLLIREVQQWKEQYAKLEAQMRQEVEDIKRAHVEKVEEMMRVAGEVVSVNEKLLAKLAAKETLDESEYRGFLENIHENTRTHCITKQAAQIDLTMASLSASTLAIEKCLQDLKLRFLNMMLAKVEADEADEALILKHTASRRNVDVVEEKLQAWDKTDGNDFVSLEQYVDSTGPMSITLRA